MEPAGEDAGERESAEVLQLCGQADQLGVLVVRCQRVQGQLQVGMVARVEALRERRESCGVRAEVRADCIAQRGSPRRDDLPEPVEEALERPSETHEIDTVIRHDVAAYAPTSSPTREIEHPAPDTA